jgi:predicted HTH domain antitoxin
MAIKRFEMKRLSSGQAAQLAGLDRTTFLMRLAENGVAMIAPSG